MPDGFESRSSDPTQMSAADGVIALRELICDAVSDAERILETRGDPDEREQPKRTNPSEIQGRYDRRRELTGVRSQSAQRRQMDYQRLRAEIIEFASAHQLNTNDVVDQLDRCRLILQSADHGRAHSDHAVFDNLLDERNELFQQLTDLSAVFCGAASIDRIDATQAPASQPRLCSEDSPTAERGWDRTTVVPSFPLVAERELRRDPSIDLARDQNRERQSRYCQGFDPDWWMPALLAAKWQSLHYPLRPDVESVRQWASWIDAQRVEYLGPFAMLKQAADLESAKANDLELMRQCRPELIAKLEGGNEVGNSGVAATVQRLPIDPTKLKFTLGALIEEMQLYEFNRVENERRARRYMDNGNIHGAMFCSQLAQPWQPDLRRMPGIEAFQAAVEAAFGPLAIETAMKARGHICVRKDMALSQANELSLADATHLLIDVFRGSNQGERVMSESERLASSEPEITSESTGILEVANWSELAIAIDEQRRYWATTPAPRVGEEFPVNKAVRIALRGARWRSILTRAASSADGRTVQLRDLLSELGIAAGPSTIEKDSRARPCEIENAQVEGAGLSRKGSSVSGQLRSLLGDLRRKLRQVIRGPRDDEPTFLVRQKTTIDTGFVVRYLIRDENGRNRFGTAPV